MLIATASAALLLAACGSEGVSVPADDAAAHEGAEIFATHCAGCHTISAAGTQGSGNRTLRAQGPDFNQRKETSANVLFAIHNGGFSGAIMPQNIVVGEDATKVAEFLAKYSGADVVESPRPTPSANGEQGGSATGPESGGSAQGGQEGGPSGGSQSSSGTK